MRANEEALPPVKVEAVHRGEPRGTTKQLRPRYENLYSKQYLYRYRYIVH